MDYIHSTVYRISSANLKVLMKKSTILNSALVLSVFKQLYPKSLQHLSCYSELRATKGLGNRF